MIQMLKLTWILAVLLPVTGCAEQPTRQPGQQNIRTELKFLKTSFQNQEPILVDVYVQNLADQDLSQPKFSPISSAIQLPNFVITRVPDGKEFGIALGLYMDDWDQWYQPASGKEAYSLAKFSLPAGKWIHLLHGDLRLTVARALEHCQGSLDEAPKVIPPDNAGTVKSYQEIVAFAEDFLKGGAFDVYVRAYSQSQTVRINIAPPEE